MFGAQADVQIAPGLTGTAQVVTRRMSDYNNTKPAFEWANLKYQVITICSCAAAVSSRRCS